MERDRWPLFIPVLLGLGIGLYFALPHEPMLWLLWTYAGGFGASVLWLRNHRSINLVLLALFCVVLGMALAGTRTWWVGAPVLHHETGAVSVTGQVDALEVQESGVRVTLAHLQISRVSPDRTPKKVRITLRGDQPSFAPGDWLEVRANLRPPPPPAMPGAFDFQRHSYFKSLGGVGFAYGAARVVGRAPQSGVESLAYRLQNGRLSIAARVRAALGGDVGAVGAALMTGQRGAIPEPVMEDMRASGLAHLLAISGLHVGLVAAMVFVALRAVLALLPGIALNRPVKKWAAMCAISVAFGYALMAGATVPTQRAFLMIALMFVAVLLDRKAISLRTVAWAAAIILAMRPESLTGASFQMSFAAAVALVAAYEEFQRRGWFTSRAETVWARAARYVLGVALTTVIAGAATGVFAAFHFNRVADFGLAANMIAVPVMALWVMPWALMAYVLMPFGLDGATLQAMGWGIEVILWAAHQVAAWPGAVHHVSAFPVEALAFFALGGLSLTLWRARLRWISVPLAAMGLWVSAAYDEPDIVVHGEAKLAAVRTSAGAYAFSTLQSAKFERDVWLRRAGLNPDVKPPRWSDVGPEVRCDAIGCVYAARQGENVAFVRHPAALAEDCAVADVVINLASDRVCPDIAETAPLVVTLNDLKQQGAYAVWLGMGGGKPRIQSTMEMRGHRPWVLGARQSARPTP